MAYLTDFRTEIDAMVKALADRFPKCFFEDPHLRRPLKQDILIDLQREGLAPDFKRAIKWYESHFAYQYALQAGNKRIDLNGNETGTVTEQEQHDAEKYIAQCKQASAHKREQQEHAPLRALPMMTRRIDVPKAGPAMIPNSTDDPLARLLTLVECTRRVLADSTTEATLRTMFGATGLQAIRDEAQAQLDRLTKQNGC